MPKRKDELPLKIGDRQRAVIKAVERIGLASVAEVLSYVSREFNIELSDTSVRSTLTRSIQNDLKSLTGTIDVRYFRRDGETEVPIDEVEIDSNGNVKNKYDLRFYIIGSETDIKGSSFLRDTGIQFFRQKSNLPTWAVSDLRGSEKNRVHIILQTGLKFISLSTSNDDLPFKVLIGRQVSEKKLPEYRDSVLSKFGLKTALLLLPDSLIQGWDGRRKFGHGLIEFGRELGTVRVFDIGGADVYYKPVTRISPKIYGLDVSALHASRDDLDFHSSGQGPDVYRTPLGYLVAPGNWMKVSDPVPNSSDFTSQKYRQDDEIVITDPNTLRIMQETDALLEKTKDQYPEKENNDEFSEEIIVKVQDSKIPLIIKMGETLIRLLIT